MEKCIICGEYFEDAEKHANEKYDYPHLTRIKKILNNEVETCFCGGRITTKNYSGNYRWGCEKCYHIWR